MVFTPRFQVSDSSNPPQVVSVGLTLHSLTQLSSGTASTTLPAAVAGKSYDATLTASGGLAPYTWSVTSGSLPASLVLNPATGQLSGVPDAAGNSTFTLTVQDQSNPPQTSSTTASISIAAPLMAVTASGIPDGVVGEPFATNLTATGGTPPFTWSVTPGSLLPAGLSLNPSGALSGTPTNASPSGTMTSVTVTDAASPAQSVAGIITVRVGAKLTVTSPAMLPAAQATKAYTATLAATGGIGSPTWTVTSGALPTGLTLNAATGKITGTPTAAGNSAFTLSVQDQSNPPQVNSSTASIDVSAAPDFTLTLPASLSVGGSGNVTGTITLSPQGGYNGTVSFSCGAVPAASVCTFSPASLTANGSTDSTATLTITTGVTVTADARSPRSGLASLLAVLLPGVVVLGWRRRKRLLTLLALAIVTLAVLGLASCGSSSTSAPVTPAGSYAITVTANDAKNNVKHTATVTLNVQ
jgi:hypothetical protein